MTTGMQPCTTASRTREDQPSPGNARQKVWPISSSWYLRRDREESGGVGRSREESEGVGKSGKDSAGVGRHLDECSLIETPSSQSEQLSGSSLRQPYTKGVQSRMCVVFGSQKSE